MSRPALLAMAGGGLLLLGAFAVTAARWQTAEALTNCTTSTEGLDGEESNAAAQINQHRVANGLAPLLVSPNLSRASAWKSADSSNLQAPPAFGHTDSLGRNPSMRAQQCGYPGMAGENIALGYSGSTVVSAWMGSPGHRANILSQYYTVMGIGHTGNSWVLNFGVTVDAGAYQVGSPAPPPPPTASTSTPVPVGSNPPGGPGASQTEPPSSDPPGNEGGDIGNTGSSQPGAVRTTISANNKPMHELPTGAPFRRATILMLASE